MLVSKNNKTWVEIDTKALVYNASLLRKNLPKGTNLIGVVKSNAYGHGILEVSRILEKNLIPKLAVDSFEEAILLRGAGIKIPIFVLGFTSKAHFREASLGGIEVTISNVDSLKSLFNFKSTKALKISIKVDTGLHRQGFLFDDKDSLFSLLKRLPKSVHINGLYSHCAVLDEPGGRSFTRQQIRDFESWKSLFQKKGYNPETHLFSSASVFLVNYKNFDFVRLGVSIYGLYPSDWISQKLKHNKLKPALSWRTIVSETKKIKKGEALGYGLTEKTKRESIIAICPVGYWHGYPRALSRKGIVLVNGKRAKVLGTISMDMMIIDVTGINGVKQGRVVTLLGRDGKEGVSAEEFAALAGTISYEIITRINPEIPRIYK